MSQSARSLYLAKVKAEKAKAESFQEAMDMAQAVIDERQKENDVSKTPGLGRMVMFKAYIKRTVKKIKRAVKGFVMFRRVKKVKAGVQSHFQTYKTIYIAVPLVAVSVFVSYSVGYKLGCTDGVQTVANLAYLKDVTLFDSVRDVVNVAAADRLTYRGVAEAAVAKAAEIKAAA